MRLASFNIRGGRDDHGIADPMILRDAVAGLDADVLALQEVDRGQLRSGGVDQVALAAEAGGVAGGDHGAHVRSEPTLLGAGGASYGIALVSRVPVRAWRRIELPRRPLSLRLPPPPRQLGRWPDVVELWRATDEPRVALAAILATPGPVATVVTTHLSFVPGVNLLQLAHLVRAVADLPAPVLLLGDLNLVGTVPGVLLGRRWRVLDGPATFPAAHPRLHLDRVLLTPARAPAPYAISAVYAGRSDHRALVVEM